MKNASLHKNADPRRYFNFPRFTMINKKFSLWGPSN